MAKAKKTAALTVEERLEQALVPEGEQPYPVPGNWCWTRLGNIAQWGSGGTPSRKNMEYYNGTIPWVKTGELCDDFIYITEEQISEYAVANSSAKLFPINSVLIAMYGATIGKVGILGIKATTNQACACAICTNAVTFKYLFYYARSQKDAFIKKGKGGAQPNISQEIIKIHEIPIPPVKEQQRIIDRIESLFAKLDEAKEKAQAALDSFETRKAALLHKAFTGELTAKWRQENGVGMDSWSHDALSTFCKSLKYGTANKSKEQGKVVVIRMGNLQQGEIDWTNLAFSDDEDDIKKYSLSYGDVLFNRTNSPELVGKTSIYRGEYPAIYAGYLIKLDYGERLVGEFLNYIMNSSYAKEYCSTVKSDGVNQSNINAKKIGAFVIPVPSIPEQTEIVQILNNFFAKEQKAKELCSKAKELCSVTDNIDLIKKSILARAFRGKLGTNDPTEESAVELLKSIV